MRLFWIVKNFKGSNWIIDKKKLSSILRINFADFFIFVGQVGEDRCKCVTPPEIGEAIIRNQLRMDVFQNDKVILKEELKIRTQEIASLTTEVNALKDERIKIHTVVGEYQRQVKVSTHTNFKSN